MPRRILPVLLPVCLALALPASAETLFDPTRPALATTDSASAPTAAQTLPPLQALIARGARYSVLIGGRRLGIGDRIGAWRITAIDREGVALAGPKGSQRLHLQQTRFRRSAKETTR